MRWVNMVVGTHLALDMGPDIISLLGRIGTGGACVESRKAIPSAL